MGIAVSQQDIRQEAPGHLLDICQSARAITIQCVSNLFVIGLSILIVGEKLKYLGKVFRMDTLLGATVKTADGVGMSLVRQLD